MRTLVAVMFAVVAGATAHGAPRPGPLTTRTDPTDLEWRAGPGFPSATPPFAHSAGVVFLSLTELSRLPIVETRVTAAQDGFLGRPAVYRGVSLSDALRALGADPARVLAEVKCVDGFTSYFTPQYVRDYAPILVFEYNGLRGAEWPKGPAGHALGPYAISYRGGTIKPKARPEAWREEPLRPSGIVSITLRSADALDAVFGPAAATGPAAARGYAVARNFCIQCHADGGIGGSPGPSVEFTAEIARRAPARFRAYVKNPQAVNPNSQMEGRPGYAPATLDDLLAFYGAYAARNLRAVNRSGAHPSTKGN